MLQWKTARRGRRERRNRSKRRRWQHSVGQCDRGHWRRPDNVPTTSRHHYIRFGHTLVDADNGPGSVGSGCDAMSNLCKCFFATKSHAVVLKHENCVKDWPGRFEVSLYHQQVETIRVGCAGGIRKKSKYVRTCGHRWWRISLPWRSLCAHLVMT